MNRRAVASVLILSCVLLTVVPAAAEARQTNLISMFFDLLFPQPGPTKIGVLNPVSNPTLWGRWIVRFETRGKADLHIRGYNGTFLGKSTEFIAVTCNDEKVGAETYFAEKGKKPLIEGTDNGMIMVRNWECEGTGRLFMRILETGHHYIEFSFGGEEAYAENLADCTGTDVSPCHMCDVNDMDFILRDPNDDNDTRGWQAMSFDSDDGDPCDCSCYTEDCCEDAHVTNETWTDSDGYTFCPIEGTYDIMVRAEAQGDSYEWESSPWETAYTVTYDTDENWCTCNSSVWLADGTGDNSKCCGDDGTADDFENAGSGNSCCINGETVTNGTTDSTNQYLCLDGEIYGCNGNLGGVATQDSGCTRRVGLYCDGAGTGADTWKSQISTHSFSDDCDGDAEDPYGEGHSDNAANAESCEYNKVRNDDDDGIENQDVGWKCNQYNGPAIAMCNLTQVDGGDFNEVYLYIEAADELDSPTDFGYIYRVGTFDAVGNTTHVTDADYPGTMFYNTTSTQSAGDIDSNEGTYGDYMNLTLTFGDMETQLTEEGSYSFEIGSEESAGSGQIDDWEDPNDNEGSCVINGTLCVAVGYSATADSDCCPVGGTTSEYPGKDDDGGNCLWCWTGNHTQRGGGNGDGKCELQCGASSSADEKDADACDGTNGWVNSTCYYFSDGDDNEDTCDCIQGSDPSYWNLGGETSATTCCEDGSENRRTRVADGSMDNGYSTDSSDDACCLAASDCADTSTCYDDADVSNDIDGDGDNDYCSSGTWYDCNTESECPEGYTCSGNDCVDQTSGGHGTTCDASNPCLYFENSSGMVARFDQFGYVDVKGSLSESQSGLTAPAGSFALRNSTDDVVFYIDNTGNLATTGTYSIDNTPDPSGVNDLIMKNSGGTVVGYINGTTGNMLFNGSIHYYSDF